MRTSSTSSTSRYQALLANLTLLALELRMLTADRVVALDEVQSSLRTAR